jgi:hypothetical protein
MQFQASRDGLALAKPVLPRRDPVFGTLEKRLPDLDRDSASQRSHHPTMGSVYLGVGQRSLV